MFRRLYASSSKCKHLMQRPFSQSASIVGNIQLDHSQMMIQLHQAQLAFAKQETEFARKETEFAKKETELVSAKKEAELVSAKKETELVSAKKEIELVSAKKETELVSAKKEAEKLQNQVEYLTKEVNRETAYKLHYASKLTVRGIIEQYEQSFGKKLQQSNQGRKEKWVAFLDDAIHFVKFDEKGFKPENVATIVATLYNSASAQIHSIETVENLVIPVKGLNEDQIKVLDILIELTGWKGTIVLATKVIENSPFEN